MFWCYEVDTGLPRLAEEMSQCTESDHLSMWCQMLGQATPWLFMQHFDMGVLTCLCFLRAPFKMTVASPTDLFPSASLHLLAGFSLLP